MRMSDYQGACFCGEVALVARGEPVAMGYCHCGSCRSWSAGPINAFSLWKPEQVEVTRGADKLSSFAKTPRSVRKWCSQCGGHLFTEHPHWGLVDVYAATIPALHFHPGVHVHYQETVLPMRDGLPKQRDVPREMGGSGELIAD
jgi:hypothetical protein